MLRPYGRRRCRRPAFGRRGTRGVMQYDYSMHMIRHDHVRTQFDLWKMGRDEAQTFVCEAATIGQLHSVIDHIGKYHFPLMGNDRDKIRARL